jgi:hypothetical protein
MATITRTEHTIRYLNDAHLPSPIPLPEGEGIEFPQENHPSPLGRGAGGEGNCLRSSGGGLYSPDELGLQRVVVLPGKLNAVGLPAFYA